MFFKGCLTSLSLSTGGIKLQASPGFIGGCQVKVGSLLESLFMDMVALFKRRNNFVGQRSNTIIRWDVSP